MPWRFHLTDRSHPRPQRHLAESQEEHAGRTWTVARWLRYWLTTRTSIRATTLRVYTRHVTLQRIRATLRAAYNAAIREGLLVDNPARRIEMPPYPDGVVGPDAIFWISFVPLLLCILAVTRYRPRPPIPRRLTDH